VTTATLYAWAVPGFFSQSPVDHTWVTTYDNRKNAYKNIAAVTAARQDYWYCWGSFHAQGGTPVNATGLLGKRAGKLEVAECLVRTNADSMDVPAARGTIFTYGVDGVCHQLANQVLYATGSASKAPLTVADARGYWASNFIYGTYGLQHAAWATKVQTCGAPRPRIAAVEGVTMPGMPDDFEERARKVLTTRDPKLLSDLLALRTDVHRFAAQRWPGVEAPNPEALNARNQHLLDQAAIVLGPEKFREVFGFPPGEQINLVDPKMKPASETPPPRGGGKRRRKR
jgi:hypothetical protein